MEKIKFLVRNIPLKTNLILLFIICLVYQLFSSDFQITAQKNIYFSIKEINNLQLKVKNISDNQITVLPDFIPNQSFSVITPLEPLIFSPGEEKFLYYSFLVENTQNSQNFSLPFILRNSFGKEIHREFIQIKINPYTSFKARLIKPQEPIADNKEKFIDLVIENESNIPCIGEIRSNQSESKRGINPSSQTDILRYNKTFNLQPGQTDTLSISSYSFSPFNSYLNADISIHYSLIYSDSVVTATHHIVEFIPYYRIYQPDLKRFHDLPAFISSKIQKEDFNNHTEWKHWLSFWGYGYLKHIETECDTQNYSQTGNTPPKNYVSWYLKKQNGRLLNQWADHDEYQISIRNEKVSTVFGKTVYEQSKLLGNHYGDGFESQYFFDKKAISYLFVKDYYRDQNTYSTFSFSLLKNQYLADNEDRKFLSLSIQTKRSDFSWPGLAGKNTVKTTDNDKLLTQLSFYLLPNLHYKNELLWFRNNDKINIQSPLMYNELSFTIPNTHMDIKSLYQSEKVTGEYDHQKSYEVNLSHRSLNSVSVSAGFRFSDEKSDYSWSFPFRQMYQSHYLKPKVRLWKKLYAISDINYYRFESSNRNYNSQDETILGGLALDFNHIYIESQAGKREYNYSQKKKNENIIRFNLRYLYSNKLMILFDTKSTNYQNKYDFNQFLTMEIIPLNQIKTSISLQNYQYQSKHWQDLFIGEGNISYTLNNHHQILLTGKYFDFVNNRKQNRYSLSFEYIIPFRMPVYPKQKLSDLRISVRDPYLNKPLKNLLIKSNHLYAITDDFGRAEFLNIPQGEYLISAVNQGKDYIFSPAMPEKITLHKKEVLEKSYQLNKPAEIHVQIILKENIPLQMNNKVLNQNVLFSENDLIIQQIDKSSDKSKGILFVLQNEDTKIVKETDRNGQLIFDHVAEGLWKIYPLKQSIPTDYHFISEEIEIEVLADKKYNYKFELVPSSISFESFSNGGKVKIKD